jgi:all-trans-retinol dehydrogenase (NAD+)
VFYHLDITDHAAVDETCKQVIAQHGSPTVLINNAGIGPDGFVIDVPMEVVRRVFETNLVSHYALVRQVLPNMIKHNHGHIVTVASMASFATRAGNAHYAASKAAVHAFHESLSLECQVIYDAPRIRTT